MAEVRHGRLQPGEVAVVTFTADWGTVEVQGGRGGRTTDQIWFTVNGRDPIPEGDDVFVVIGRERLRVPVDQTGPTEVRLLCSRATGFSVIGGAI